MKLWQNLKISILITACLWLIFLLDLVLPWDLRGLGIRPRTGEGLWGLVLAPLLHVGPRHLAANSGALIVLLTISLSLGRALTWLALAIIALAGGLAVWALAPSGTVHLGASGVIFGLTGFLLFSGILRRDWRSLVAALAVLFLYGGIFFNLLVVRPGVSWSSHFFGFLAGVLAAWLLKNMAKPGP